MSHMPLLKNSLNVDDRYIDFKPLKNVSALENGSAELPKLRSALKLSTVETPKIQTEIFLDNNNNADRRGSVGLGRSKSVCNHKVKFVPATDHESSNEGKNKCTNILARARDPCPAYPTGSKLLNLNFRLQFHGRLVITF